jgi:glycosyltransferase involved in cell wall biosynthesis
MPASTDRTTVVVIAHNYARFLRQAVNSALAQTRTPRVLIMDDASSDETPRLAQEIVAASGGRVQHHRSDTNQGLSRTRNSAAALTTSSWVIYLDADDWLRSDFVAKGEDHLAGRPHLAALTTDMVIVRDERQPFRSKARVPRDWRGLLRKNTLVHTCFIRRDVVLALGGYDPGLHYEDWDFWLRLLKAGHAVGRLPGGFLFRREHGLNKSKLCDDAQAVKQIRAKHSLEGTASSSFWSARRERGRQAESNGVSAR